MKKIIALGLSIMSISVFNANTPQQNYSPTIAKYFARLDKEEIISFGHRATLRQCFSKYGVQYIESLRLGMESLTNHFWFQDVLLSGLDKEARKNLAPFLRAKLISEEEILLLIEVLMVCGKRSKHIIEIKAAKS